jgi:aspartyl/asparaginyl-tRNA synthetase
MEDSMKTIGESLDNFQAALNQSGSSLGEFIRKNYADKWLSDEILHAMAVRTTFVQEATEFLREEGLFNIERVMLSILTDPLAHDIEHTPAVPYKGQTYVTTHSMIYSKFLACSNKKIKGIYVDSPNIRLELPSPQNVQRGKYLADFSQIDIELRRNRDVSLEDYLNNPKKVREILAEDFTKAINFFERLIVKAVTAVIRHNAADLKALGVVMEVPAIPFPAFPKDKAQAKYGAREFEEKCGGETKAQFYWITGLFRENYDLVYPYLLPDGKKIDLRNVGSESIYNYDLVAKSIDAGSGKQTPGREILSGALREWLFEPIVERILDNRVLPVRPIMRNGNIENIAELGGYGPFLYYASMKDESGRPLFPDTMGGGIGVERALFALLRGRKIEKVDDITFFGKNPDSHPLYLF